MSVAKQISFSTTPADLYTILQIAERAVNMAQDIGVTYSKIAAVMDLSACHVNGCALHLDQLLAADDMNFAHDVFGIRRHLNRRTGELTDCFMPRYAAQ